MLRHVERPGRTPRWPRSWAGRWARSRPTPTAGCGSCGWSWKPGRSEDDVDDEHHRRHRRRLAELAEDLRGLRADPPATLRLGRAGAGRPGRRPHRPCTGRPGRCWSPTTAAASRPPPPARTQAASPSGSRPGSGGPCGRPTGPRRGWSPRSSGCWTRAGGHPAPLRPARHQRRSSRPCWPRPRRSPRARSASYAWVAGELRPAGRRPGGGGGPGPQPGPGADPLPPGGRQRRPPHRRTPGASGYKRALLAAEGADPDELERLGRRGTRFFGSDTTRIYCYPTCAHARRVTDRHPMTLQAARPRRPRPATAPAAVCRPAGARPADSSGHGGRLPPHGSGPRSQRPDLSAPAAAARPGPRRRRSLRCSNSRPSAAAGRSRALALGGVEGERRWPLSGVGQGRGGPRRAARPGPRPGRPGTRPRWPPAAPPAAGPRARWPAGPGCSRPGPAAKPEELPAQAASAAGSGRDRRHMPAHAPPDAA